MNWLRSVGTTADTKHAACAPPSTVHLNPCQKQFTQSEKEREWLRGYWKYASYNTFVHSHIVCIQCTHMRAQAKAATSIRIRIVAHHIIYVCI